MTIQDTATAIVRHIRRRVLVPPGFNRAGQCELCDLRAWQQARAHPYVERYLVQGWAYPGREQAISDNEAGI